MRIRRRYARRIANALGAGVIATIALGWLAMFLPAGNAWYGPPAAQVLGLWKADDQKVWRISRGANAWHTTVVYWHMQISGLSLMIPTADYEAQKFDFRQLPRRQRPEALGELNMMAWYHQTGWPMPAMSCEVHWQRQIANSNITYTVSGGAQLPRDADFNPRALPLKPIWGGLAADTGIFAGAWLLAAAGLRALRARWRARRDRCPQCGYSLAGLPAAAPCPECGR